MGLKGGGDAMIRIIKERNRRGQSIAEYAILFAVVIGAYVAMQVYTKRGMQARVKSGTDALTSITTDITSTNQKALTATFAKQSQYEPYYMESVNETYQESVEQEHMGAGKVVREKVSDVTARAAGGYQKQKGAAARTDADALWNDVVAPAE
jgi:hypothetical protein